MKTTILFWLAAVSIPSVLVAYVEPARFSFVPLREPSAQTAVFALERRAVATGIPGSSAAPVQAIAESRAVVGRCAVNRACE
jgi:hypothetical protein